jgi:hypothetical protein
MTASVNTPAFEGGPLFLASINKSRPKEAHMSRVAEKSI